MSCYDFGNFEESLLKVMSLAYWHPHSNIYLYYHTKDPLENIARIFFIFRYYRACNVILIQYDDIEESLLISLYTPYVSDSYDFENKFGCWTKKKVGMPIYTFEEAFICEINCHNVSINSKLRANNLGTCVGIITHVISYNDSNASQNLTLFEDKGKNFHGFPFRTFVTEILPFMQIRKNPDNTYALGSRDGTIWNTVSKLLNFTMDLTASLDVIKKPFDFEINIQQIFTVAHRKGDLFLNPIYQFDVIVVELDYTFGYKESGVCFVSRRAEFETVLFDLNTLLTNYDIVLKFTISFYCIWILFCVFSWKDSEKINIEFIGRNLMNSVRSVLNLNLCNPPKTTSFRIFLTIIIWSFFIINFSTQAAIISFFSAFKRGQDVDTFDDIVEKGYRIEGLASPDVVLPETEERFRKINSKLSPIRDIFACVTALRKDSYRFCLLDCSVGRYLERNMLNEKGQQYLHIAKDRVHSYYLNIVFPKYSVMSENFNKYMVIFFEAGLVKKWEDHRYSDMKEEVPIKPLSIADLKGIFNLFAIFVAETIVIFIIEFCVGNFKRTKIYTVNKIRNCKRTLQARNFIKAQRKQNKIKQVNNFTQT